jgi:hypothetical protein
MRRILMFLTLGALAIGASLPPSPELLRIKTVYILPMRLGFDQYLASQLAQSGLLRVVTDPKKADGVLTDHLGASFEATLDDFNPPPPPPPEPKPPADAASDTKTTAKKAKSTATSAVTTESSPPPRGSFSSGRGNVFLVDRTGRSVLWSTYEPLESAQPDSLTHIAEHVVKDLKHALQLPKVKPAPAPDQK